MNKYKINRMLIHVKEKGQTVRVNLLLFLVCKTTKRTPLF